MRPFVVPPDDGLSVRNPAGGMLTFKARSGETAGSVTVVESTVAPGEGPPLHVHQTEDEFIYILAGRFIVKLGEELLDADQGTFVFIPRGTPHTWQNATAAPGRFLAAFTPATAEFEQFFVRFGALPPGERDDAAFGRLAAETGVVEVVGPPLG